MVFNNVINVWIFWLKGVMVIDVMLLVIVFVGGGNNGNIVFV